MGKKTVLYIFSLLILCSLTPAQDSYIKISANVNPKNISNGSEGTLLIKITASDDIKISSHPEMIITLNDNTSLTFSKKFFKASELDYQTKQENGTVFLDLEKEVEIPFKVNQETFVNGKITIHGEVAFTAVDKENWSLKTFQKFDAGFFVRRSDKPKNN